MKYIYFFVIVLFGSCINAQNFIDEYVNNGGISSNSLSFSVGEIFVIEERILGEEEEESYNNTIAYPNPTHGFITIKVDKELTSNEVEIYDLSGRLVMILTLIDSKLKLHNLASGAYLIKSPIDEFQTIKIIKY